MAHGVRGVGWWFCLLLVVGVTAGVLAQQATTSDADLVRQRPLALDAAHGERPRYGDRLLSTGTEGPPLIERVEAPNPNTVVVYGKGPSSMLLSLFANGWNMIIPKHISEKDPVNALKTQVIGTGPFRLKEPPTTTLVKYERNPDYFIKGLPYLDEIEMHLITDPQALAAAIVSKRVFWNDAFPHPNLDGDMAQSMVKQNANLVHA